MAEEIPADLGQAYSSYVPAVGGDGGVDRVVHIEDRVLARGSQFSLPVLANEQNTDPLFH